MADVGRIEPKRLDLANRRVLHAKPRLHGKLERKAEPPRVRDVAGAEPGVDEDQLSTRLHEQAVGDEQRWGQEPALAGEEPRGPWAHGRATQVVDAHDVSICRRRLGGAAMARRVRLGVLTGGGDCPGLNAAIRAIVRKGIDHYGTRSGYRDGWRGPLENAYEELSVESTRGILPRGGRSSAPRAPIPSSATTGRRS